MTTPRVLTTEEVRNQLLDQVWTWVHYWDTQTKERDCRGKLEGLAFSILVMLDGANPGLPCFDVIPHPHETDQAFYESEGENWFPPFDSANSLGMLHEHFHQRAVSRGSIR